ncbi:MAG: hypothetical protein MI784_08700, partial [Cytophagales bacterium]|nr:hypothetical protein [Cytophagales bacterium]
MMNFLKNAGCAFFLMLLSFRLLGQQAPKARVQVKAFVHEGSVLLRWAPEDIATWRNGNKHGYWLERFTIRRDGKLLRDPERKQLADSTVRPYPLQEWEAVAERNDWAAVAAQSVYGNSFDVDASQQQSAKARMLNLAAEWENRFTFGLHAADQSLETAELMGLFFRDEQAREREEYVYRVRTAFPDSVLAADTATVFVSLKRKPELPRPGYVEGRVENGQNILSWDTYYGKQDYLGYWVERSEEGQPFVRLNARPAVTTRSSGLPAQQRLLYADTSAQNFRSYRYRIVGRTFFELDGPPSDTVSLMAYPAMAYRPSLDTLYEDEKGRVHIEWKPEMQRLEGVKAFVVQRSAKTDEGFQNISAELELSRWDFIDPEPLAKGYYRLAALDHGKHPSFSMEKRHELQDTIPPAVPVGLTGEIDSLGAVRLRWNQVPDQDLLGYRVYRSNFRKGNYIQATTFERRDSTFHDRVTVDNLHEEVYYRVMAVDRRGNQSALSEPARLDKPDLVPPASPVFTRVLSTASGASLRWSVSSSKDVKAYALYRKLPGEQHRWELLRSFAPSDSLFCTDRQAEAGIDYYYTVLAVDDAGLESPPARPVKARKLASGARPPVRGLAARRTEDNRAVRLSWEYGEKGVHHYVLYRAENEEPMREYKQFGGIRAGFIDREVSEG